MTLPLLSWQAADEHAHSGGTATSSAKAKCSTCDAEYGELASGGYYYYTPAADTKKPAPSSRAATAGPLVSCRCPRLPRSLMVSTAAV